MSTQKGWWIVLLASAILLAFAVGLQFNGRAQAAAPQAGITIPYSGQLTDASGLPVSDGKYDFTFTLYDTASSGTPAWFETQSGVAVQSGSFTAQLGRAALLPASAKDGQKWLAVSVRGPGEADFTALEPRQPRPSPPLRRPLPPGLPAPTTTWGKGGGTLVPTTAPLSLAFILKMPVEPVWRFNRPQPILPIPLLKR